MDSIDDSSKRSKGRYGHCVDESPRYKAKSSGTLDELHRYRRRLRRYLRRLETSRRLSEAARADGGAGGFEAEAYAAFRDASVLDLAVEMAQFERFSALSVLLAGHRRELGPLRLRVLSFAPETTRPLAFRQRRTS